MSNHPSQNVPRLTGPNHDVLEAQSRVCTGPTQSRPLGVHERDPDPKHILSLVLASARGEMPPASEVSAAQMGAFFAAMTIRRRFPEDTTWSPKERAAFAEYGSALLAELPPAVRFLIDPSAPPAPSTPPDAVLVAGLARVLRGDHLSYEETVRSACAALDPLADPALAAALIIGQRMNRETFDEFRGYLDAVRDPADRISVSRDSLTHVGEPYNGSTRYFKPTLFVAAARAALGRPSILHGAPEMPPKFGVTEEQILAALGARVTLSLEEGAALLEDASVGFCYVSLREFAPHAYAARHLRTHIAKRPPWAATEKAQQLYTARGRNCMVIGYFHPGYEEPQLRLMRERGCESGVVIKGEEGTSQCTLRLGKPSDESRKAVNYVQGFRREGNQVVDFAQDIDPAALGFHYDVSPRVDPVSAESFAQAGRAALAGEHGHVYDRILLNTAVLDATLGFTPDLPDALSQARRAIDSGAALAHLDAYIRKSRA